MTVPPVVAVEIGTSKVVALVGEAREDGHVMITGVGEVPSIGVRKGEVIDPEHAGACLRSALAMAEERANVAIREVHLALAGGHVHGLSNGGTVPVFDKSGEITADDIDEVIEVAKAVNLGPDREVIHTICQSFSVDDQEHVLRPEGMVGSRLSLEMLVLHGVRNRLQSTIKVVTDIPLGVQDVAFSGLCSALAVLTAEQKKGGVIAIDLGGGTTDYVVYAGSVLATAGSLGIGGDHITNDIVLAFNLTTTRAEKLKREEGGAVVDHAAYARKVSLPAEVGFPGRTLRVQSLQKVINARAEEILRAVRKRIEPLGVLRQIGAGVVLTGGGARLRGIEQLAASVFGLPCSVGAPRGISGLTTAAAGPEYATCIGLVQYGFRTSRERPGGGASFIERMIGKVLGR